MDIERFEKKIDGYVANGGFVQVKRSDLKRLINVAKGNDVVKEVWVLNYTHKHGTDIQVFENEADCRKSALALVKEYREDFRVDSKMSDSDALMEWEDLTGGDEGIWWENAVINDGAIS